MSTNITNDVDIIATVTQDGDTYVITPEPTPFETSTGFVKILNATTGHVALTATVTYMDANGDIYELSYVGPGVGTGPNAGLYVGLPDTVGSLTVTAAASSRSPAISANIPVIVTSSTLTITPTGSLSAPFAGSNNAMTLLCSTGTVTVANQTNQEPGTPTTWYLYTDSTAGAAPAGVIGAGGLCTVQIASDVETIYVSTQATYDADAATPVGVCFTNTSTLQLYLDTEGPQTALPPIIEGTDNLTITNNAPSNPAAVWFSGVVDGTLQTGYWDGETWVKDGQLSIAADGGSVVTTIGNFDANHQLFLHWDVTHDPVMVVMRPTKKSS